MVRKRASRFLYPLRFDRSVIQSASIDFFQDLLWFKVGWSSLNLTTLSNHSQHNA